MRTRKTVDATRRAIINRASRGSETEEAIIEICDTIDDAAELLRIALLPLEQIKAMLEIRKDREP